MTITEQLTPRPKYENNQFIMNISVQKSSFKGIQKKLQRVNVYQMYLQIPHINDIVIADRKLINHRIFSAKDIRRYSSITYPKQKMFEEYSWQQ